ncbi:IclR family transcriptional regulator [Halobellus marinus]|uniref:IclR family transcriptional regulator n=1 Tax=Halobellus TaxID=1073986 RepID=UPI0028B17D0B|nr:IclR family transcriptional regulator [Halobellus sp. DFY28]
MGLDKPPNRPVKTADTIFGIVEFLLESGGSGVKEIAESQDLAQSTVHSHLATLLDHEYVVKEGTTYRLSLKFLDHGMEIRERLRLTRASQRIIEELSDDTGEVVWVVVEEHGQALYLLKSSGENAVQTRGRVGRRTTMHDIAAGKAILAHLPDSTVDDIIESFGLPERTEKTITEREALYQELKKIRDQGYATNDGETTEKVRAVASAVLFEGEVCGAVGIAGPKHRLTGKKFHDSIPSKILEAVDTIELNLEYW